MDRRLDPDPQRTPENASEYAGHPEPGRSFENLSRPREEYQPPERYYSTAAFSPESTSMFEAIEDHF
jgi:hypothetical protein